MKTIVNRPGSTAINREDRDRVAGAIEKYLRCEIDNFELDDALFAPNAEDRAAFEIAGEVWFFYDDCRRHKNEKGHKILEAGEARLHRWVQLLRSDHEWPSDEPDSRRRWYSPARWQGVTMPVGCVLGLLMLPWMLIEVIVLRRPRPKSAENEHWPFQSVEEWAAFAAAGENKPSSPGAETATTQSRCPSPPPN